MQPKTFFGVRLQENFYLVVRCNKHGVISSSQFYCDEHYDDRVNRLIEVGFSELQVEITDKATQAKISRS